MLCALWLNITRSTAELDDCRWRSKPPPSGLVGCAFKGGDLSVCQVRQHGELVVLWNHWLKLKIKVQTFSMPDVMGPPYDNNFDHVAELNAWGLIFLAFCCHECVVVTCLQQTGCRSVRRQPGLQEWHDHSGLYGETCILIAFEPVQGRRHFNSPYQLHEVYISAEV